MVILDYHMILFGNISTSDLWMSHTSFEENEYFLVLVAGSASKVSKNKAEKVKDFLSKKDPYTYCSININDLSNVEKDHAANVLEVLNRFQITSRIKVVFCLGADTPLCDNFQRWLDKNNIPYGVLTKGEIIWKFEPKEEPWGILPSPTKKAVSPKEISKRKRNLQRKNSLPPTKKESSKAVASPCPVTPQSSAVGEAPIKKATPVQKEKEPVNCTLPSHAEPHVAQQNLGNGSEGQEILSLKKTEQRTEEICTEEKSCLSGHTSDEGSPASPGFTAAPIKSNPDQKQEAPLSQELNSKLEGLPADFDKDTDKNDTGQESVQKINKRLFKKQLPFTLKKIKDGILSLSNKASTAEENKKIEEEKEKKRMQAEKSRVAQRLSHSIEQAKNEIEQTKTTYLYYLWQSFKLSVCVHMDIPPEASPLKDSAVYTVWLALLQSSLLDDFDQNKGSQIHWMIPGYPDFEKLKEKASQLYKHRTLLHAGRSFRPPKGVPPVEIPVMDKTPASNQIVQVIIRNVTKKKEEAKNRYLFFKFLYALLVLDRYTGMHFSLSHQDACYTDYIRSDYLNALYQELLKASDAVDFKNSLQVGYQINICRVSDTDFHFLQKIIEDTAMAQNLLTAHPEATNAQTFKPEVKDTAKPDKARGKQTNARKP